MTVCYDVCINWRFIIHGCSIHDAVVLFCSDNYLQISFSCLEKGIDFKELLGE